MKLKGLFDKYNENSKKLLELGVISSHKVKSVLIGYGLSLAIVISPIIILYNLFLYPEYQILLIGLISLFAFIFFTLSDVLYHRALGKYDHRVKDISFKENYIINSAIYFVICLIVFIAAIFII